MRTQNILTELRRLCWLGRPRGLSLCIRFRSSIHRHLSLSPAHEKREGGVGIYQCLTYLSFSRVVLCSPFPIAVVPGGSPYSLVPLLSGVVLLPPKCVEPLLREVGPRSRKVVSGFVFPACSRRPAAPTAVQRSRCLPISHHHSTRTGVPESRVSATPIRSFLLRR